MRDTYTLNGKTMGMVQGKDGFWQLAELKDDETKRFYTIEKVVANMRTCDKCGCLMAQGFVIDGGESYYCDDCHGKVFTDEEWSKIYDDGESDSYWTIFED